MSKTTSTIKKYSFAIGIIILINLLFVYGVNTFYKDPSPQCYMYSSLPQDRTSCVENGGVYQEYNGEPKPNGYCDFSIKCNPIMDEYNRNVAVIALVVGLALLIFGIVGFKSIPGFATGGFILGGIGVIIQGVSRYWNRFSDATKFVMVLISIITLIYLAIKFKRKFER